MSKTFDNVVKALGKSKDPVSVTAAAGCGKTEAIVRAVELSNGKQLIIWLTLLNLEFLVWLCLSL